MAFGKIDLNDSLVSPFFVLAFGVQADLFDLILFGFDFSSVILTLGSGAGAVEITAARIIAVAAVLVAFATNKPDLDEMGMIETWVAVARIGLVLAPPFMPVLADLITFHTVAGVVALIVQSAGFYSISYLG
jgi:hypothetical protein